MVQHVKQRVTIYDVLQLYGLPTKKTICCPFHSDHTPSLSIYTETNSFYCWGCGTGGDVIKFVELYNDTDFRGAVDILCAEFNITRNTRPTLKQKHAESDRIQRAKAKQLSADRYKILINFKWYLKTLPETTAVITATQWVARQLEIYLDEKNLILWDVTPQILNFRELIQNENH